MMTARDKSFSVTVPMDEALEYLTQTISDFQKQQI